MTTATSAWHISHAEVSLPPNAVAEGWWHPNVKSGQVHDHSAKQPQTMHRLCEQVYRRGPAPALLYLCDIPRHYNYYTLGRTRDEALQLALDALKKQVFEDVNVDEDDWDLYLHLNFGLGETDGPFTIEHLVEYYGCEPTEIEVGTAVEYGTDRVLSRTTTTREAT